MTASKVPGHDSAAWSDNAEQDVRPYALTGGRTVPRHPMRLATMLAARHAPGPEALAPEAVHALLLCRTEQRSVAEIAAHLRHPVQVVKIILSDLIDCGALAMAVPGTTPDPDNQAQLLEALLAGLRTKFFPQAAA